MFSRPGDRFPSHQRKVRRGSLPLKKRRFQPIKDVNDVPPSPFASLSTTPLTSPLPQPTLMPMVQRPLPAPTIPNPGHEFATLALLASASADHSVLSALLRPASANCSVGNPSYSIPILPQPSRKLESSSASSLFSEHDDEENEEFDDASSAPTPLMSGSSSPQRTPGKRIRHGPLLEPLPGGCHGKSSRHNSYCRRLPRYNGSKYCKLHYRQYVGVASLSSNGSDLASLLDAGSSGTSMDTNEAGGGKKSSPIPSGQPPHQDRRYMGDSNDKRCCATTTRGRACAYVAVRETNYCYLHSDYDTNPPPRRGGCSQTTKAKPTQGKKSAFRRLGGDEQVGSHPESRTVSEDSLSSAAWDDQSASESSGVLSPSPSLRSIDGSRGKMKSTPSQASRRANAKRKHADSPFPLLSMISTDQWSQKSVRIATGPFKDRIGIVEKWGNGWVSVSVSGVGMHNRRSFELYLNSDLPIESTTRSGTKPKDGSGKSLMRCVSRELGSPPLLTGPTIENGGFQVAARGSSDTPVTPSAGKGIVDIYSSNVPETPEPTTFVGSEHLDSALGATVTPSVQQDSRPKTNVPLVDSLLLSEPEGKKSKLDMLFGTAALDRSRRLIHKPTRFEPSEITSLKTMHALKNSGEATRENEA